MTGVPTYSEPAPDLARYTGTDQFGLAYQVMLENDSHAAGSVDRILMGRMVRLFSETTEYLYADFTPITSLYDPGSRPVLELRVASATERCQSAEGRVEAIVGFCEELSARAAQGIDAMVLGGTEEEIIARGSDWCTDIACGVRAPPGRWPGAANGLSGRRAPGLQWPRDRRGVPGPRVGSG